MEAVIDMARGYSAVIRDDSTCHTLDISPAIVFNKSRNGQVEVRAGEKEKGTFTLLLDSGHFSNFSPGPQLRESFQSIFDYYIYEAVTRQLTGKMLEKISVIIPLPFSIAFENILYESLAGQWDAHIYRDAEVYAAYYLNESSDGPELNYFAKNEQGAHVYGMITSGKQDCLVLYNYKENEPPEILQIEFIEDPARRSDAFKLMVKQNSNEKSRVFFFNETDDETEGLKNNGNWPAGENQENEPQIEIHEHKNIKVRRLGKKNPDDDIFDKGLLHLEQERHIAPVYHFSLYTQATRTVFPGVSLEKDLEISIDFRKNIPAEFFINLLVGPHPEHCILFERIFVDISAEVETHFDFKGRFRRLADNVNVKLYYKDKIKKECDLHLRNAYRIT